MQKVIAKLFIKLPILVCNNATVGRELRMIELKEEINVLCRKMGKSEPYSLFSEGEPDPKDPEA